MRVICETLICRPLDTDRLQDAINRLIDRAEGGPSACRVVGVGVALQSPAGEADPDCDVWLVVLNTTGGPEEVRP